MLVGEVGAFGTEAGGLAQKNDGGSPAPFIPNGVI